MGQTDVAPGTKSGDHHHGEAETAISIRSGTLAFASAATARQARLQTEPGFFLFAPLSITDRG